MPPTPEPLTNKPYFEPSRSQSDAHYEPGRSQSDLEHPRDHAYFHDKGAYFNSGIDNRNIPARQTYAHSDMAAINDYT